LFLKLVLIVDYGAAAAAAAAAAACILSN